MPAATHRRWGWLLVPWLLGCGQISLGSFAGVGGAAGAGGGAGIGGAGAIGGDAGAAPAVPDASAGPAPGEPGPVAPDAAGGTQPPGPADAGLYPGAEPPSCRSGLSCGPDGASCCEARRVPAGTFNFGVRASGVSASIAHVSEFHLDTFEVTVGRYREFSSDYDRWRAEGNPRVGAAAHPRVAGSGWQASWTASLPLNSAGLEQAALACDDTPTSTLGAASVSDQVPMNCLTWYEAFAFCAWDGGRLPTHAELEYAAAGGSEGRLYPWGSTPPPSAELAVFDCTQEGGGPGCSPLVEPPPVASRPLGVGRWGQHDLAGSLSEWLLDVMGAYPPECTDCVALDEAAGTPPGWRAFRGGSWLVPASELALGARLGAPAEANISILGLRCARDAP